MQSFISSREAHCVAPSGGDERCEGTPLEITITSNQYTKNEVALRRVSSARIVSVFTKRFETFADRAYGNISAQETVVLVGFGFQDSIYLACRFQSLDETQYSYYADRTFAYTQGERGILINAARFVNATRMECDVPAFTKPTRGNAVVEITLDGTVYSSSALTYQVVGEPVGIATFTQSSSGDWQTNFTDVYSSDEVVKLRDYHIFVMDSAQQRLRRLGREIKGHHGVLGQGSSCRILRPITLGIAPPHSRSDRTPCSTPTAACLSQR